MLKKYLFFTAIFFIEFGISSGQNCPPSIGSQSTTSAPHFKIDSGSCEDYPESISINGKSFVKSNCIGTDLYYDLLPPDAPLESNDTFSVNFGFGSCDYSDGESRTLSDIGSVYKNDFNIFPNPVDKGGMVSLTFRSPVNAEVSIYDLTGKQVFFRQMKGIRSSRLNLSGLANGIYLIKVESDTFNTTKKIILQR